MSSVVDCGHQSKLHLKVGLWNYLPDQLKDCMLSAFAEKLPALCKAHLWQSTAKNLS
jgi:hypothetical protein